MIAIESVFLIGEFKPGDLGHSYERGFQALGTRTVRGNMSEWWPHLPWTVRNRTAHRLTQNNGLIRTKALRTFNLWLEEQVIRSGAQALVSLSLRFILPETYRNIRRAGIVVAAFYPDNPFPPHYAARPETLPAARETNVCFVWSEKLAGKLRRAGIRGEYLPFAWAPDVFPYSGDQPQGTWPGVLFLGGWDREREAFLEEVAGSVPLRIYGPHYWGTRTRSKGKVRQCWQKTDLRLSDAARAIRESAVCLNVLRTQHIIDGEPDGTIMRHFEVPGAGGFLLATRSGGATEIFPEGEAAEYFSDTQECIAKAKRYIADHALRRKVAERGHAIVAGEHHYENRARQILGVLDQHIGQR